MTAHSHLENDPGPQVGFRSGMLRAARLALRILRTLVDAVLVGAARGHDRPDHVPDPGPIRVQLLDLLVGGSRDLRADLDRDARRRPRHAQPTPHRHRSRGLEAAAAVSFAAQVHVVPAQRLVPARPRRRQLRPDLAGADHQVHRAPAAHGDPLRPRCRSACPYLLLEFALATLPDLAPRGAERAAERAAHKTAGD